MYLPHVPHVPDMPYLLYTYHVCHASIFTGSALLAQDVDAHLSIGRVTQRAAVRVVGQQRVRRLSLAALRAAEGGAWEGGTAVRRGHDHPRWGTVTVPLLGSVPSVAGKLRLVTRVGRDPSVTWSCRSRYVLAGFRQDSCSEPPCAFDGASDGVASSWPVGSL